MTFRLVGLKLQLAVGCPWIPSVVWSKRTGKKTSVSQGPFFQVLPRFHQRMRKEIVELTIPGPPFGPSYLTHRTVFSSG